VAIGHLLIAHLAQTRVGDVSPVWKWERFSLSSQIARQKDPQNSENQNVFGPGIWWIGLIMNLSGSEIQILQMYS